MDRGGNRDSEANGYRRKKRERHCCGDRRAIAQRRDRKANRIGIKLSGQAHCSSPRPPRSVTSRPRRPAIARTDSPLWKRAVVPALPRERKPAWLFAEAQVGEMLKVGLEDISEGACRWPLGDPVNEDFVYCGLATAKGRSYCAGHCRMAYKPPNARVWDGQRYVALESMAAA